MFLKIGDFLLSLDSHKKIPAPFDLFKVEQNTRELDIEISAGTDYSLQSKLLKGHVPVFKSDACWEIYNWRDRIIFRDIFNNQGINADSIIAVSNREISSVNLYSSKEIGSPQSVNPLSYPLGSLILLSKLARKRGIFLHASGIKDGRNRGFVFCGPSGVGKSTVAKLWQKSGQGRVLNDDRLIVRKKENRFFAYGCPWHSKDNRMVANEKFEIKEIFFLMHSRDNYAKFLNRREAFLRIIPQAFFPAWDKSAINSSLSFLKDLCGKVRFFELRFKPTKEIIDFIRRIN